MNIPGQATGKPIRVAMVCSTLNQLGGAAVHIRNIYNHLNGGGLKLTMIFCSANEKALREFMVTGGVDEKDMLFIPHAKKRLLLPFILELRDLFQREKFDVVHAFETQTQVLAGLAARWAGVKCFLCHCVAQFLPLTIAWPKRLLFTALNFFLKDGFTRSITVSHGLARELIEGGFRPRSKVEVVHLGIKLLYEGVPEALAYPGFSSNAPVIGTLSRLSVEKGLDRFVRAAALVSKEVPSARFVICGKGPDEQLLKDLAKDLGIDHRIEFTSFPFTVDIRDVLKAYDIYTLPSLREGLPITLLEAMSMGRPAVASDIEGAREVINNGVDGVLVDTSDIKAFAETIISLCLDKAKAIEMGRKGLEKVRTQFHVDREMQRLREIYHEVHEVNA